MKASDELYGRYVQVLREELVPAMGCTEPIAIAYGAAKAREVLGRLPERVQVDVSGNILKNVKSVIVPNTGGRKGVGAAAAAGIVAGDPDKLLEVIAQVTPEQKDAIGAFLERCPVEVGALDSGVVLDIQVTLSAGDSTTRVRISQAHTNIVEIRKDGRILFEKPLEEEADDAGDRDFITLSGILDFVESMDVADVAEVVERQIAFNSAIAAEGMRGDYGANIGKVLIKTYGNDIKNRARAMAAAGSDARMNGCELPVVIVSGSGNQGMAASLPVIEYARELDCDRETTIRAVALADLVTIHQKSRIGRLSAYCGAVSAGAGSGAGIAYLLGGRYGELAHTLVNALAITSGIICDGAKASCAAKIATSVDAGILGYYMYQNGQQFRAGDGIVTKGVEETLKNVGRLGKEGMRETDREIIHMMAEGTGDKGCTFCL